MGIILKRKAVKLFIGFIYKDEAAFQNALKRLEKYYGKADFQSRPFEFLHTDYYRREMGDALLRKFAGFRRLILPQELPAIKLLTNRIEKLLLKNNKRTVNIDPGYLDPAKVILATTKDYNHRIYLDKGIFAEVTLFFSQGEFRPWQWTYPDYGSREYAQVFEEIRKIYVRQIA